MSFKLKTAMGFMLVQIIASMILIYGSTTYLRLHAESDIHTKSRLTASLLSASAREALLVNDYATLNAVTKILAEDPDIAYARVKNDVGSPVAENGSKNLSRAPFHADTDLESSTDGVFDTFEDIYENSYYLGRVEIGYSTEAQIQEINQSFKESVFISAVALTISVFFAYILTLLLTRQITLIANATGRIASGELGVTVPVTSSDEVGKVAKIFNSMSESVQASHNRMTELLRDYELAKKEAEAEKNRLAAILNAVVDAVVITDRKGMILAFNPAAETMFGYTPDEVIGKNVNLLMPSYAAGVHQSKLENIDPENMSKVIGMIRDIEGMDMHGNTFPIEIAVSSAEIDGNTFYTGIIRNISDRKSNELELIKAKKSAEEASNAKTSFIAVMSHEIKTPMNVIIGLVDVLKEYESDREKRKKLDSITKAAEGLMNLLNDLLDLSKIDTGRIELECAEFDPYELIRNTFEFFKYGTVEKGLEMHLYLDKSIPGSAYGDSHRLRQILTNLIGNAVKFTQTGYVSLKAEAEKDGDCWILKVEVTDTGIGIRKENLESIFDEFVQADQSMTRKYGGTGLGLAICKKLTKLMDGQISAASTLGKGSTFSFSVRLFTENSPTCASLKKSYPVLETARPKILIAEDSEDNRSLIILYCKDLNADITFAFNGLEALEKYQSENFDIIMMDRRMPVMSGDDAAAEIRKHEIISGRRIPIISFSANLLNDDNLDEALYDGHFSKPFRKGDLTGFFSAVFPNSFAQQKDQDEDLRIDIDDDIADLVPAYLLKKGEEVKMIIEAADNEDFQKAEILGHSIKGTGKSYGFIVITEIGRAIESAAKASDVRVVKEQAEKLKIYVEKAAKSLE
jgi:PAS domain S-box-containing protein